VRTKKLFYLTAVVPALIALALFIWFLAVMFEGESPSVVLEPMPEFLSKPHEFTIKAGDEKRGLRSIRVSLQQSGRDMILVQDTFPFQGLLNTEGARR